MLNWLLYRFNLWRFHHEKFRTHRCRSKILSKAHKVEDIQTVLDDIKTGKKRHDLQIDDDISQLTSDYLQREAERLLLPVPKFSTGSNEWEKSAFTERWRLTQATMHGLRSAIRAEKKERSELARAWLSGLTGVIGVLIGLLAVILGRR
jgi:hypothetical protein